MNLPRTIEWVGDLPGYVRIIDQTLLPGQLEYRSCGTIYELHEAIRNLRVRGAPAIGVAAAMGVVLGMQRSVCAMDTIEPPAGAMESAEVWRRWVHETVDAPFGENLRTYGEYLKSSRPTAVNLAWAVDRVTARVQPYFGQRDAGELLRMLLDEALAIQDEDRRMCRTIGRIGASLVADGVGILTHCNAGGLATAEYGTALAVMYSAAEAGRRFQVFADETRPLLQGARLTAWELRQAGIDVTLICDSMAGQVMREGKVQLVIVGADRIARNGDTANKIGTYSVAILAKAHGIPFYVAAPSSTFDLRLASGSEIPIEERDPREITHSFGQPTAPEGVRVYNPAFDVTPAELIAGIVTEKGLIQPVAEMTIRAVLGDVTSFPSRNG